MYFLCGFCVLLNLQRIKSKAFFDLLFFLRHNEISGRVYRVIELIDWHIERFSVFIFFPDIFFPLFTKVERTSRHIQRKLPHHINSEPHRVRSFFHGVYIVARAVNFLNRFRLARIRPDFHIFSNAGGFKFPHNIRIS